MQKKMWFGIAAAVCAVLLGCTRQANSAKNPAKLNVLFLVIDDLRPELGCYGDSQVKSPNIDKLASQGLLFSRAYCQVPVCGASRACLMTSILPTSNRFVNATTWAEKEVPNAKTLPQMFKEAGYTTISNGKIFHHAEDTGDRSWTEPAWNPKGVDHSTNLDPETTKVQSDIGRGRIYEFPDVPDNAYKDGQTAEKTIEDLQRLKAAGKPFFLACGFIRPHLPFYAPKKYWDLYDRDKIEIADNRQRPQDAPKSLTAPSEYNYYHFGDYKDSTDEFHRMMRHGYFACTSYSDKLVGDVLAELDRLGLTENTVVVLWGDHGWQLGEHNFWGKHNTMYKSLRVPLIIKAPGKISGQKTEAMVETIDIFPTLCTLAGLPVPKTVQGRSFTALLDNPNQKFREVDYSRYGQGDAVVTERYTYTRYKNNEQMLYDRQNDPQENHNIVGSPEYSKTAQEMGKLLKACMEEAKTADVKPGK